MLLATDFDETYFPRSGILPPENREALEYFMSEGGRFTISTGRARSTFAPFLPLAPVNAPVILYNGAQLYDFKEKRTICAITVPETIAADLEDLAARIPEIGLEAYHGEDVYIWNPNPWTFYHLKKARCAAEERAIAEIPQPWGKAILHQDQEILLRAQADLLSRHGDRYEAIFSNFHMLELTAKGCTKGSMVLRLAELLEIRRENIYCVGDNQNDISMLAVSAIPFAPANCSEEVRAWGAFLLPRCEDGAVAALIRILDSRYH